MSLHPSSDGREGDAEDQDRPVVPESVLRGIENIAEGRIVNKEDLDRLLKY